MVYIRHTVKMNLMNGAVHRLNLLIHSMEGHFVIRRNALFVYDQEDHLQFFIPAYILQIPSTSTEAVRLGIRRTLLAS